MQDEKAIEPKPENEPKPFDFSKEPNEQGLHLGGKFYRINEHQKEN